MPRSFLVALNLATGCIRMSGNTWRAQSLLFASHGVIEGGRRAVERGYATDGAGLAASLKGQFSAAIVDTNERCITLVQDALGIGQLSWGRCGEWIVAGTSPMDVAATIGAKELDEGYFAALLGWGTPRTDTPFRGVHALDGGTAVRITRRGETISRPWQPEPTRFGGDPDQRLEELLTDAIDLLVPADTAAIFEVSGGTDSAVVSLQARRMGRDFDALTFVSDRYLLGEDDAYSKLLVDHLGVTRHAIDSDVHGLCTRLDRLPDHPGACRYLDVVDDIARLTKDKGTRRHVTGVGGDLIFDYAGLVPAFLADPVVRFRPLATITQARRYAIERGRHRSTTHYLRYVALPIARWFYHGESLAQAVDAPNLPWLRKGLEAHSERLEKHSDALGSGSPSTRYLWDSVFDMARGERLAADYGQGVLTVHPLLHRPLVEFMLSLNMETRRGLPGDRRLQRRYLARHGPAEIAERRCKGSSEPLRQVHVAEAADFLADFRNHSRLEAHGWVEREAWRQAVDQAALGANPKFAFFGAAIEVELWLRALEEHGLPRAFDLAMPPLHTTTDMFTSGHGSSHIPIKEV